MHFQLSLLFDYKGFLRVNDVVPIIQDVIEASMSQQQMQNTCRHLRSLSNCKTKSKVALYWINSLNNDDGKLTFIHSDGGNEEENNYETPHDLRTGDVVPIR